MASSHWGQGHMGTRILMRKYTWQSNRMVIRQSSVQGKQQYAGILWACNTPTVVYFTHSLLHQRTWAASDSFAQHSSDADWRLAVRVKDKYNSNSNTVEKNEFATGLTGDVLLKEEMIFGHVHAATVAP